MKYTIALSPSQVSELIGAQKEELLKLKEKHYALEYSAIEFIQWIEDYIEAIETELESYTDSTPIIKAAAEATLVAYKVVLSSAKKHLLEDTNV